MLGRLLAIVVAAAAGMHAGCESSYKQSTLGKEGPPTLREQVRWTIRRFKDRDPSLDKFFKESHAYVVFPKVAKGAVGVGGAGGEGEVYEQGKFIGRAELSQGSVGVALGFQVYSELIFMRDKAALSSFKSGDAQFSAQASAVVVHAGGAAAADYEEGVAVFVMPESGMMFEASIGGQGFKFIPLRD